MWRDKRNQTQMQNSVSRIDSTPSGFGDGIDNISDLNSQPRPCCGLQDVDTVLEFVFGVHYIDLDVRSDERVDALATLKHILFKW